MNDLEQAQLKITEILVNLEKKLGRSVDAVNIVDDGSVHLDRFRRVKIDLSYEPGEGYLI